MYPDDILLRNGRQTERVGLAEVPLVGERQGLEILLRAYLGKINVRELLPVELALLLYGGELTHYGFRLVVVHPHDGASVDLRTSKSYIPDW